MPLDINKLLNVLSGVSSQGGLLSEDDMSTARMQGLMGLGSSLLASSGYSQTPTSFGQALGQGLMSGQQMARQSQQNALQQLLLKKQLEAKPQKRFQVIKGPDGQPIFADEQSIEGQSPYMETPEQRKGAEQILLESLKSDPALAELDRKRRTYSSDAAMDRLMAQLEENRRKEATAGQTAYDRAYSTATGRGAGAAQSALPQIESVSQTAINDIDKLIKHPGLDYIVGAASLAPIVPGTPQAAADALAKQIQGQTFLAAYESLRGGGQITQIEGEKAEAAKARLQRAQSKEEYVSALQDLQSVIKEGVRVARLKANKSGPQERKETAAERASRLGL